VFIQKYREKVLFCHIRKELGKVFYRLARQKESLIEEGHLMADHVRMMISIPPKYAVSQIVGFIKGKSAIHIAWTYIGRKRNFVCNDVGFAVGYLTYWLLAFLLAQDLTMLPWPRYVSEDRQCHVGKSATVSRSFRACSAQDAQYASRDLPVDRRVRFPDDG
jgi:REP element-mobilizing transposase RayT